MRLDQLKKVQMENAKEALKKAKPISEGVLDGDDEDGFMARAQLYHLAKYAIDLHSMIGDRDNLEPWVQAKITKAADYLDVVKHYLEYQAVKAQMSDAYRMDTEESFTYAIAKQAQDHMSKNNGQMPSHVEVDGKRVPVRLGKDDIKKIVDWAQIGLDDNGLTEADRDELGAFIKKMPTLKNFVGGPSDEPEAPAPQQGVEINPIQQKTVQSRPLGTIGKAPSLEPGTLGHMAAIGRNKR